MKGDTRASTSRSRSFGRPAQTVASIGTSVWWLCWRSEAAGATKEETLPLSNAGGVAAVSSSSPRGLVLQIVLGACKALVEVQGHAA
jgi:hypothetical protein